MIKNEILRMWVNRVIAFLAGGLVCFIFLQIAVMNGNDDQIKELTKELDEIKYEAGRLLDEGKTYFEKNDYDNAKRVLTILFGKHPLSEETTEGKIVYTRIEKRQEEIDQKWDAAEPGIREEWTKKQKKELKDKMETEREELLKNMDSNLDKEWDQTKDGIRKEWEKNI